MLMLKIKVTLSVVYYGSVMVHLLRIHIYLGHTYGPMICGWSAPTICPIGISDCWKHFFLPAKQCSTPYLQFSKELFTCQSNKHTMLAIQILWSTSIKHLRVFLCWGTSHVSKLPHNTNWNACWLNHGKAIRRLFAISMQIRPNNVFKRHPSPYKRVTCNKCVIIIMIMPILIFIKVGELESPCFLHEYTSRLRNLIIYTNY